MPGELVKKNRAFVVARLQNVIDETNAFLPRGATTYASDEINLSPNRGLELNLMRNDIGAFNNYNENFYNFSLPVQMRLDRDFLSIKSAIKHKLGNCQEQSILAAMYLWENNDEYIDRIEVVIGGPNFDHVFLLVNRPFESSLDEPQSWGEDTYLCDPWSSTVSRIENPNEMFETLFACGVKQTELMAQNGIEQPWVLSKYKLDTIPQEVYSHLDIHPKQMPYPLADHLFTITGEPELIQADTLKMLRGNKGNSEETTAKTRRDIGEVSDETLSGINQAVDRLLFDIDSHLNSLSLKQGNQITNNDYFIKLVEECGSSVNSIETLIESLLNSDILFDLNTRSIESGMTALDMAAYYDNDILVKLLLQKGATPCNLIDNIQFLPMDGTSKIINFSHYSIYFAAKYGNELMFNSLWQAVEDEGLLDEVISHHNEFVESYLLSAALEGNNIEIVSKVLTHMNHSSEYKLPLQNWLKLSVQISNNSNFKALINSTNMPLGDTYTHNGKKITPLWHACSLGDKEKVETLLSMSDSKDLNYNYRCIVQGEKEPLGALEIAIKKGFVDLAANFIENAMFPNDEETLKTLNSALILAAKNGYHEIAQMLINKGANVNHRDIDGYSPLHYGANFNHNLIIKTLMSNNANIYNSDNYSHIPIHYAIAKNNFEATTMLAHPLLLDIAEGNKNSLNILLHEAFVNVIDGYGRNALSYVAENGNLEMVRELLRAGINISYIDSNGKSAISYAYESGNEKVFNLLVTTLIQQASYGNESCFKLLSYHGLLNTLDSDGYTLLHRAIQNNAEPIFTYIVNNGIGIDVAMLDNHGHSPIYYAFKNNNHRAVNIILNKALENKSLSRLLQIEPLIFEKYNIKELLLMAYKHRDHDSFNQILSSDFISSEALLEQNEDGETLLYQAVDDNNYMFANQLIRSKKATSELWLTKDDFDEAPLDILLRRAARTDSKKKQKCIRLLESILASPNINFKTLSYIIKSRKFEALDQSIQIKVHKKYNKLIKVDQNHRTSLQNDFSFFKPQVKQDNETIRQALKDEPENNDLNQDKKTFGS